MCVKLLHDQAEEVSDFCLFFSLNLILTIHYPPRGGGQVIDFGVETSGLAFNIGVLIMGGWIQRDAFGAFNCMGQQSHVKPTSRNSSIGTVGLG